MQCLLTRHIAGTSRITVLEPCATNACILVVDNQFAVLESLGYSDCVVDTAVAGADDYDFDRAEVLYFGIVQGESGCFMLGRMRGTICDTICLWEGSVIDM